MRFALMLSLALACTSAVASDPIVVVGKLISNKPMDYVPDECPANAICLRSWWRSAIDVEKTVAGQALSGRVDAAVMQHTGVNKQFKKNVRVFALRYIEDPAQRAKLRVDYYLDGMAEPQEFFCLGQDPAKLGLKTPRVYVSGEGDLAIHCFELPEARDSR